MVRKFRHILGIQSYANPESGAAILRASTDGELLDYVAISEERLIREKYPYKFPLHSLGYCMDHFGLESLDQIDALVTDHIRIKRWFRSGPSYPASDFDYIKIKLDIDPRKISVIRHHLAHAASTYFPSGFPDAAVMVVDGNGSDVETTSFFMANGTDIEPLDQYRFHGIGTAYSYVTSRILSLGTGGEGKTMGLAPYGEEHERVIDFKTDLTGIKNDFSHFMRRLPLSDVLNHLPNGERLYPLKQPYDRASTQEELMKPYFARAAFDIQEETEKVMIHLAVDLQKRTGARNLCVAGGVGLNSVANKKILDTAGFEDVFFFPACSDAGIPLGLAIWGYYNLESLGSFPRRDFKFNHAYTGKEYDDDEVRKVLTKYSIKHAVTNLSDTARLIADGKIVHWFQGGSEYGPRALGNRSILADARREDMKDFLNTEVKHREHFRPYAPAVLEQYADEYFELDRPSPYMLLIANVKKPDTIPAVTHVDQTARVQTVNRQDNGAFCELIEHFYKQTGVPVILNTSYNDAGEPIVETPEDALINFLRTKTDYLVLNHTILIDPRQNEHVDVAMMAEDRRLSMAQRTDDYLERFCPGYNDSEAAYYLAETNKMAEWHTKYRSVYELERKTREWVEEKKRIIIVGTPDHTVLLPRYINEFVNLNVTGFVQHPQRFDHGPSTRPPYLHLSLDDLENAEFDEVLVSSWEFQFDILDKLKGLGLRQPVYPIYDNASRSFTDVLKDRFPVFAKADLAE